MFRGGSMIQERITVIFWNEMITVDGVEKRIPLRIPMLLKLKRLEWHASSMSGMVIFNDDSDISFTDPYIVKPFLDRWNMEPVQTDVEQLKSYMDEMTIDPNDVANISARHRWAEIEKRHVHASPPKALLQLLSDQNELASDESHQSEKDIRRKLLVSLLEQDQKMQARLKGSSAIGEIIKSSFAVREEERRKLQRAAKKRI